MLRINAIGEKIINESIDNIKGLAIISIVLGHHNAFAYWGGNWFWSFNIPFFFFVTGYCSESLWKDKFSTQIKKVSKNLLFPYVCTICVLYLLTILITHNYDLLLSLDFFSGLCYYIIYKESPLWFLVALFFGRLIISLIKHWGGIIIYIILFFIGYILSMYIEEPFYVLKGLMAPLFIYVGNMCRIHVNIYDVMCKLDIKKTVIYVFTCMAFLINAVYVPINFFYFDFPLGLFNVLTSTVICYTLVIVFVSINLIIRTNIKKMSFVVFKVAGKYSLYIVCFHTLELILNLTRFLPQDLYPFRSIIVLLIAILSIPIVRCVPFVNVTYHLK